MWVMPIWTRDRQRTPGGEGRGTGCLIITHRCREGEWLPMPLRSDVVTRPIQSRPRTEDVGDPPRESGANGTPQRLHAWRCEVVSSRASVKPQGRTRPSLLDRELRTWRGWLTAARCGRFPQSTTGPAGWRAQTTPPRSTRPLDRSPAAPAPKPQSGPTSPFPSPAGCPNGRAR